METNQDQKNNEAVGLKRTENELLSMLITAENVIRYLNRLKVEIARNKVKMLEEISVSDRINLEFIEAISLALFNHNRSMFELSNDLTDKF